MWSLHHAIIEPVLFRSSSPFTIAVYTKPKGQIPDYTDPVVMSNENTTIEAFCNVRSPSPPPPPPPPPPPAFGSPLATVFAVYVPAGLRRDGAHMRLAQEHAPTDSIPPMATSRAGLHFRGSVDRVLLENVLHHEMVSRLIN